MNVIIKISILFTQQSYYYHTCIYEEITWLHWIELMMKDPYDRCFRMTFQITLKFNKHEEKAIKLILIT